MPSTPAMGLVYPAASDAPDGPGAIYNLALSIETVLSTGYRGISDWVDYNANPSGINGSAGGNPGWVVTSAKRRYRAGRIQIRGSLYLSGGGAAFSQQVYLAYPIAALVEDGGWGIDGRVTATRNAGGTYDLLPIGQSTSQWTFGSRGTNGLIAPNGASSPFAWAQGDSLSWNIDYDFQN